MGRYSGPIFAQVLFVMQCCVYMGVECNKLHLYIVQLFSCRSMNKTYNLINDR